MTIMLLPAPSPMDCEGNTEEHWKAFKKAFEDFSTARELGKKDNKEQVATLKTLMGLDCKKAEKILTELKLPDEKMGDVKEIIKTLDDNFIVNLNVLYDENQFYLAAQQQHEPIEQFLDRLHACRTKVCRRGGHDQGFSCSSLQRFSGYNMVV